MGFVYDYKNTVFYEYKFRNDNEDISREIQMLEEQERKIRERKENLLEFLENQLKSKIKNHYGIKIKELKYYSFIFYRDEDRICLVEVEEYPKKLIYYVERWNAGNEDLILGYFSDENIEFFDRIVSNETFDEEILKKLTLLEKVLSREVVGFRIVEIYD